MSQTDSPELVQVYKRRVEIKKVKRGQEPVIQLILRPNERVVTVRSLWVHDYVERATIDHVFEVWIEARLGA